MSISRQHPEPPAVALVDAGHGRRLERFGERVVDRPAPAAVWPQRAPATAWAAADLRYDAGAWSGTGVVGPWPVEVAGLAIELRPTASGGVGLFPEQLANVRWLDAAIAERRRHVPGPVVLNLFAHTGLLTLAAARAGAAVVHVDGSKPAVAWARRNAERSGLADRQIRWLVDDAAAFVAREVRRGRRYDGLILDPPSFGRAGGRRWRLVDDLPRLLAACAALTKDDPFVLLTAHTTDVNGAALGERVAEAFGPRPEVVALALEAESGATLDLGWAVRIAGAARQVGHRMPAEAR